MKTVVYADPPYIGCAKKHYNMPEVDHEKLITETLAKFDHWALSCTSTTLKQILPMCPDAVRVMAWVKPFCSFKPGVNPAYAWEPVIVYGAPKRDRKQPTVRDWVSANILLKKGVSGAKPPAFSRWLFQVFDMQAGDVFVDMFPGSGLVLAEWHEYIRELEANNA